MFRGLVDKILGRLAEEEAGPLIRIQHINVPDLSKEGKMGYRHMGKLLTGLTVVLCFVFFTGLVSSDRGIRVDYCSRASAKNKSSGPPSHAKAHGYRAKHTYRYYPAAHAYYDVDRKTYFYLEGDTWRVSVSLPISLKAKLGDSVTIGMDTDKPYTGFEEHRLKYPSR